MKKFVIAFMALSFLTATVGASFAQETKQEDTKKKKKKSSKKKKTEETK
jgi:hypothetical protein